MRIWFARKAKKPLRHQKTEETHMHLSYNVKGVTRKALAGFPVYGYKRDPKDRNHWIVDDETAEVVREIYRLSLSGYGSSQIRLSRLMFDQRAFVSAMSRVILTS
jgi:hypothetical protein